MESSEFELFPGDKRHWREKKMTHFRMSFASEEAVVMLFFVAKETEP